MEAIQAIGGVALGFGLFSFLSLPGSRLNKKLPQIKIWIVQLFPRLKIQINRRFVHIHHWLYLSAIFTFLLLITSSFANLLVVKGILLGGMIQGFTYKDRFSFFEKSFGHQANRPKVRQQRASGRSR